MCTCKHTGVTGHFCCHEGNVQTLGLVASFARNIKNGAEFDDLFPRANLQDKIINPNGTVKYTVQQMEKVVNDYNWQTKKIAKILQGNSIAQTLENIWNFFYQYYQYKLDKEGVEELRTPARAWYDGQILARNPATKNLAGIDCDCFSISVSSVLTNLGIKHKLRVTKYGAGWQHVYVVIPVPNNAGYNWIIDCVLDKFNIEKTYTDKFDYTMETLGIPVAILSGVTDAEELQGITSGSDFDIQGFGGDADPNAELGALRNHLVRTRNYIQKNPESVLFQGGAPNNVKMLNYAIKNWDSPKRMEALTELAKAENQINVEMGLAAPGDFNPNDDFSGYDDATLSGAEDLEGIDDLADQVNGIGKANKAPKKFFQNVRKAAGNATVRAKAGTKKAGAFAKKGFKAVVRYNPLTLAARGGFLLTMEKGLFDLAWALAPGYFTAEEAASKGISEDKRQRAIKALAKTKQIFVNTLQGKEENLKKAILKGYTYISKKTGKLGEIENLVEPSLIASITAVATPIIKTAKVASSAGLKSKDGVNILQKVVAFLNKNKEKIKKGSEIAKKVNDKRKTKKALKKDANGNDIPETETEPANSKAEAPNEDNDKNNAPQDAQPEGSSKNNESDADAEANPLNKMADKMKNVADVAQNMMDNKGEDATDEKTDGNKTPDTIGKEKAPTTTTDTKTTDGEGFFAKAKNFVKANPGKTVAGVLIVGTVITLAVSKKARTAVSNMFSKKSKKGLSGVVKKRKTARYKRVVSKYPSFDKRKVKYVQM